MISRIALSQAMNKEQIENNQLLSYWQMLALFPEISPMRQDPPEPDFFLQTPRGLIGIENTQLIEQKDSNNVD